ncbi:MAG: hypothetical protein KGO52_15790 [Nitrospirota bacterium]|nr:hypothetical protein [Nitrospirota bacterium]
MADSDSPSLSRQALYYPFHLCHERTLSRLLDIYASVHFRDYMALQLTQLSGTTAYADRMGGFHEALFKAGRIVQGYNVSGPLDAEAIAAVNRDLADSTWRGEFHHALREDRRFQRGLFELSHGILVGNKQVPGPAALLRLIEEDRVRQPWTFAELQRLSGSALSLEEGYRYEYGLALVKTSASLVYTIRLCRRHGLEAVTDSEPHFRLLTRTCDRDGIVLRNQWVPRQGY